MLLLKDFPPPGLVKKTTFFDRNVLCELGLKVQVSSELTFAFQKCKKIAQSTDDVIVNKPHVSDEEEEERPFYNHPFKLSEPKPIFFNLSVSATYIFNAFNPGSF